jgi:hypothetical protein
MRYRSNRHLSSYDGYDHHPFQLEHHDRGHRSSDLGSRSDASAAMDTDSRRRHDSGFRSITGHSPVTHRRGTPPALLTGDDTYDAGYAIRRQPEEGRITWRHTDATPSPPPERRYRRGRQGTPEAF